MWIHLVHKNYKKKRMIVTYSTILSGWTSHPIGPPALQLSTIFQTFRITFKQFLVTAWYFQIQYHRVLVQESTLHIVHYILKTMLTCKETRQCSKPHTSFDKMRQLFNLFVSLWYRLTLTNKITVLKSITNGLSHWEEIIIVTLKN